jgi:hypothetical protein
MLEEKFRELNEKLDTVLSIVSAIPTWYPITREYAKECGYQTAEGLKKWCYNNLNPDDFVKKGKHWFINVRSIHLVKMKAK